MRDVPQQAERTHSSNLLNLYDYSLSIISYKKLPLKCYKIDTAVKINTVETEFILTEFLTVLLGVSLP